jgi:uncharacterized protein YkwD
MLRLMRGSGRPPTRVLQAAVVSLCLFLAWTGAASAAEIAPLNGREAKLIARINDAREAAGLPKLRAADALTSAATRHAKSMGKGGYFRHELRHKGSWKAFGTWIGWYWPGPGYQGWSAGENLAWGAPDLSASSTVEMWMDSPGHRANILGNWRRVGVSFVHVSGASGYYRYSEVTIAVAEFGRRSG